MYNRYIPREEYSWVRAGEEGKRPPAPRGSGGLRLPPFLSGGEGLSALFAPGDGTGVLSRALKALHLEDLDTGDILLLLIVLYLMAEGDDLDLVIALGLVLIMGLGEDQAQQP